jgi:TATA-box binding protein (TBP) (component of TFIID and TFIIIB)
MKNVILLLVILSFTICKGGTIDPSVPDEKYKNYGSKFKCVLKIIGTCNCEEKHTFSASAVAISPNWALTAAHVVKNSTKIKIQINNKDFEIDKIIVNEKFNEAKLGYDDIALCYSKSDFNLDFYPKLYEKNDEVKKIVSICGYGMTGSFSTGANKSDEIKRAGSNIIERIDNNCLICNNSGGTRTQLEFLIANGDSGGGLFINNELAGINSFVSAKDGKPNSSYGDESAHTRISVYKKWIEEKMKNEK